MLKINEQKFMEDYANVLAKKDNILARCRADAAEVGAIKGYDPEKIERLYNFLVTECSCEVAEIEHEAEYYTKYLEEVEEPAPIAAAEPVQPVLEIPGLPVQENM